MAHSALLIPRISQIACPLCGENRIDILFSIAERSFLECSQCDLLFIPPSNFPSFAEEKSRYDQHNNCLMDAGYIRHLDRVRTQLVAHLKPGALGLDFGCGPDRCLSRLFEDDGFAMDNYDPFYGPALGKRSAGKRGAGKRSAQYDFITCSEVAEHFSDPRAEFNLMQSLLCPNGWVSIMTNLREGDRRCASWWYLRDITHRCFYSKRTFEFISGMLPWRLESVVDDVITFQSP